MKFVCIRGEREMLRYYTAGESHGKCLVAIIEGIPAGLRLSKEEINKELARRQGYAGRGKRMQKIEKDKVEILAGLHRGETIGSPICLMIENKDWSIDNQPLRTRPRPGHADLAGVLKYAREDIGDILERASARETAARVALGAVAKKLLQEFAIRIVSFTEEIGGIKISEEFSSFQKFPLQKILSLSEFSPVHTINKTKEKLMLEKIKEAEKKGDTLGGIFVVIVDNVPVGLGSYAQWDLRLDGCLAQGLMSIPGVKGVEIGAGFSLSKKFGSEVHDEIFYDAKNGFYRRTNNAGGLEGGITNGERIILRAVMKPISSLKKPLHSVDIKTKKPTFAEIIRGDICVVPVAGVVGEAMAALEIAKAMKEKFAGDSLKEMKRNYEGYLSYLKR